MDKQHIDSILKEHEEWVASRGSAGKRANLSVAALWRADLSGADLRRADLRRANLSGADLRNVTHSCSTIGNAREIISLQVGGVVMCCLNNIWKTYPDITESQPELLEQLLNVTKEDLTNE